MLQKYFKSIQPYSVQASAGWKVSKKKIYFDKHDKPIFCKACPVPYAIRSQVIN